MTAQIKIGTCSWTNPALTDNTSFFPSERVAGLWVKRTPNEFTFDIKAFRLLAQHPTPAKSLWKGFRPKLPDDMAEKNIYMRDLPRDLRAEAAQAFRDALMPLHSAGKLGVVLLYGIRSGKGLADLLGVF